MGDIDQIIARLVEFRDARDWDQFHNPKDLALAISVEAGVTIDRKSSLTELAYKGFTRPIDQEDRPCGL